MMLKKGAAHFEMIFSFIFFMSFVFFLMITLKPYETNSLPHAVVEELGDSFEDSASTNITSLFLMMSVPGGWTESCFSIGFQPRLFKYGLTNIIVEDSTGNIVNSGVDSSTLVSVNIQGGNDAYKVTSSPDFVAGGTTGCNSPSVGEYFSGNLIERDVISNNSIGDIRGRYYSDYDSLKDDFNVPDIMDFSITFRDFPEMNMETFIPDGGDVLAKEELVEVLYSNGTTINTLITFKAW